MSLEYLKKYDQLWMCHHDGTLAPPTPNGKRLCLRCGRILLLSCPQESPYKRALGDGTDVQVVP